MKIIKKIDCLVILGWALAIDLAFTQISFGSKNVPFINHESKNSEETFIQQGKSKAEIERAANHLYKQALKKYKDELYWKSAIDLIVVLDFYTEFSKLDKVISLLGSCLYEMGMFDGADRMYRYLLKAIPKTPQLPDALLGLQKINYQKKDYKKSLKFYRALETHYSTHDGINESRYYAGQTHFHLKNFALAPQIFKHIGKRSEFYPFGLYTSGLIYLKKKI
ncbi:MAG: tol-pal system YbgF family protein [bacterium]